MIDYFANIVRQVMLSQYFFHQLLRMKAEKLQEWYKLINY
jgi:hypothetical protein